MFQKIIHKIFQVLKKCSIKQIENNPDEILLESSWKRPKKPFKNDQRHSWKILGLSEKSHEKNYCVILTKKIFRTPWETYGKNPGSIAGKSLEKPKIILGESLGLILTLKNNIGWFLKWSLKEFINNFLAKSFPSNKPVHKSCFFFGIKPLPLPNCKMKN